MAASLNPYISQFGEEFDAEKSSQYRMAIQFSLGGLSYALLDNASNTLIGLECYQSDLLTEADDMMHTLERALEDKGLIGKVFQQVVGIIDKRTNCLVPETIFDPADKEQYLDFSFHLGGNRAFFAEKLDNEACYNVFAWSKALHDKVLAKWKTATIVHSSTLFIDWAMQTKQADGVFVNVRNRDFDMVIKKDGKLFFFNNFMFNTKDDFAYFLLFAMEQNGCSGHNVTVCFSGLIQPASEIIDLCGRYVRDIHFAKDTHKLKVCNALNEVPYQYYHIHYQSLGRETSRHETRDGLLSLSKTPCPAVP